MRCPLCHQKATDSRFMETKKQKQFIWVSRFRSEHRGLDTNLSEKSDLIPVCVCVRVCVLVQSDKYHRAVPHTYAGGNGWAALLVAFSAAVARDTGHAVFTGTLSCGLVTGFASGTHGMAITCCEETEEERKVRWVMTHTWVGGDINRQSTECRWAHSYNSSGERQVGACAGRQQDTTVIVLKGNVAVKSMVTHPWSLDIVC